MNLKEVIWKNRTSVLLLLLLFLIIYNSLPFIDTSQNNSSDFHSDKERKYNIKSSSLYPNGYKQPSISPAAQVLGNSVEKTPSTKKYQKLKSTPKPKTPPKPKVLPETVSSTVQGRDSDRQLIIELLSDLITEYMFYYELAPDIYVNKSGTLLKDDSNADQIFLYNGTQNRTNALSIKLIPKTYFFNLVNSCEGNESKIASLNFVFDRENNKLALCKEDLATVDYIIGY